MKRFISVLLLCVFAALAFTACADNSASKAIVGKWKYSLNDNLRDVITDVIEDERVYVDIYYEFNEDGTGAYYSSIDTDKQIFEYEYDGAILTLTMGNNSFDTSCVIEGNEMTVIENGETVVFKKD